MKETTTTTKKRLSNQHRSVCTGGQLPVASIALPCPIRKGARRQCTVLGTRGTGYFNLPSSNIALGPAGSTRRGVTAPPPPPRPDFSASQENVAVITKGTGSNKAAAQGVNCSFERHAELIGLQNRVPPPCRQLRSAPGVLAAASGHTRSRAPARGPGPLVRQLGWLLRPALRHFRDERWKTTVSQTVAFCPQRRDRSRRPDGLLGPAKPTARSTRRFLRFCFMGPSYSFP